MFEKFFQKRIQKDISKLEEARKRCLVVMQNKGLSENEISQVDGIAYKKASVEYVKNPVINPAIKLYLETVISEALKLGYDVR